MDNKECIERLTNIYNLLQSLHEEIANISSEILKSPCFDNHTRVELDLHLRSIDNYIAYPTDWFKYSIKLLRKQGKF